MGKYDRNLLKICNIIGIWNNSCTLFLHMLFYLFYLSLRFFFRPQPTVKRERKRTDLIPSHCLARIKIQIFRISGKMYIYLWRHAMLNVYICAAVSEQLWTRTTSHCYLYAIDVRKTRYEEVERKTSPEKWALQSSSS